MKYPHIVASEKREPIRVINWPWLVVAAIAGFTVGELIYLAGKFLGAIK